MMLDPKAKNYEPDEASFDQPLAFHPPSRKLKQGDQDNNDDEQTPDKEDKPKRSPRKTTGVAKSDDGAPKKKSPRSDITQRSPLEKIHQTGGEKMDFASGGPRRETGSKEANRCTADDRWSPDRRRMERKPKKGGWSPRKTYPPKNQFNPQDFCMAMMSMQRMMSMWNKGQGQ